MDSLLRQPNAFGCMRRRLAVGGSLYDALSRLVRYSELIGIELKLEPQVTGEACRLTIEGIKICWASVLQRSDAVWASLLSMGRMMTNSDRTPFCMQLSRLKSDAVAAFYPLFQAPVEFAAPRTSTQFDRATVEKALPTTNRVLAQTSDQVIAHYCANTTANEFADRARTWPIEKRTAERYQLANASTK